MKAHLNSFGECLLSRYKKHEREILAIGEEGGYIFPKTFMIINIGKANPKDRLTDEGSAELFCSILILKPCGNRSLYS